MAKLNTQPKRIGIGHGKTYLDRTHRPLQCLIFLLPLLALYQIGITLHPWIPRTSAEPIVIAFQLMLRFFASVGVAGNYLTALALVIMLLGWHFLRKDPWEFDPLLYMGMLGECLLWSLPIVFFALVVAHGATLDGQTSSTATSRQPWETQAVLSIGAGIYEELLFRLILLTTLLFVFKDLLRISFGWSLVLAVVGSAVLFSLYHYLGTEPFTPQTFFFRTAAGIYFGGIFIFRGFGVDVGTHVAYDLIAVYLQHAAYH